MSRVVTELRSRSADETRDAGRALGRSLGPGALVLLSGPLGAGKTELVRGIAAGLGAGEDEVASPTFALVHEYGPAGAAPLLVHADLYRLLGTARGASATEDLGIDEARARGAVVAVEWPEGFDGWGPAVEVEITPEDDGTRRIVVRRVG